MMRSNHGFHHWYILTTQCIILLLLCQALNLIPTSSLSNYVLKSRLKWSNSPYIFAVNHIMFLYVHRHMKIKKTLGKAREKTQDVLHLSLIKNTFYDKMDLRFFHFHVMMYILYFHVTLFVFYFCLWPLLGPCTSLLSACVRSYFVYLFDHSPSLRNLIVTR